MSSYFGYSKDGRNSACAEYPDVEKPPCLIDFIESDVHLVMINELYDESLVMLMRMLNWDMGDILYLKLRVQHYKAKNMTFPERLLKNHEAWSSIDYAIYNHFRNKLENQIESLGEPFKKQVTLFRNVKEAFEVFCRSLVQKLHLFARGKIPEDVIMRLLNREFKMAAPGYAWQRRIDGRVCVIVTLDPLRLHRVLQIRGHEDYCKARNMVERRRRKGACSGTMIVPNLPLNIFRLGRNIWPLMIK